MRLSIASRVAEEIVEDLGRYFPEMVIIPAGRFLMGALGGNAFDDERPQHSVWVPSFLLGRFLVTQEQWAAVMTWTPPYRCRGQTPGGSSPWHGAGEFCRRLAGLTGAPIARPARRNGNMLAGQEFGAV